MCSEKFPKFHRKTPAPEHRPATLIKLRLWHKCFPVKFEKFLGASFSQNTSGWQFLIFTIHTFNEKLVNFYQLVVIIFYKKGLFWIFKSND